MQLIKEPTTEGFAVLISDHLELATHYPLTFKQLPYNEAAYYAKLTYPRTVEAGDRNLIEIIIIEICTSIEIKCILIELC